MSISGTKFSCDLCGKQEKGKGYLKRHFDSKHRKYFCNACDQVYSQKNNLLDHLRKHFERFICQYCGLEIYRFEQFQKHIYQKHEPTNKQLILSIQSKETYKCRHCVRTFPNPIQRNSHEFDIHKGRSEVAFKCTTCNLVFITKEKLRSHSFDHYEGTLHFCGLPDCDRFFKTKKQLRYHTNIHGAAKYECDKCQQKFFQSSNYSKHKKRCKGKPKETKKLTKEEQEEIARAAKKQFLLLGGTLRRSCEVKSKHLKPEAEATPDLELVIEYLEEYSEEVVSTLSRTREEKMEENPSVICELPEKNVEENPSIGSPQFLKVFVKQNSTIDEEEAQVSEIPKPRKHPKKRSNSFICDICGLIFPTQVSLRIHLKKNQESLSCCNVKFCKKTDYNRHQRLAHNISWKKRRTVLVAEVVCDICGTKSRTMNDIRRHMNQHLKPKETCNICHKELRDLTKHMNTFHPSARFSCSVCDSSFKTKSNLRNHSKLHEEPRECPICHKFIPNWARHIRSHSRVDSKSYCLQCGKVCSSKHAVETHVLRVHEKMPIGKSYICPVCQLNFIRNCDLRRHAFIHYVGKIFNCEVPGCNEMFKTSFKLQCHMMVHSPIQEANFQCNFCYKKYLRKGALHKHQKQTHADIFTTLSIKAAKETV